MSRKGESIFKRKDGRWEGRYIKERNPQGKAIYGYAYGKTYWEAKEKMVKMVAAAKTEARTPQESSADCITFGALATGWLCTKRENVKESTFIKYRNLLNCNILPRLGKIAAAQVTVDILKDLHNWLLTKGGRKKQGLSPKTVADAFSIIRSVLRYAEIQKIPICCTGTEVTVRSVHRKMRVLSAAERKRLVKWLAANPSRRNLGILVCLYTGMRLGEVCALRWEDISEREKTIYVRSTMQRLQMDQNTLRKTAVIITAPKSASSIRTIPVPPVLQNTLDQYRTPDGYLLTGTEAWVEPRTMENYFKRILKAARLPRVNFHCLRHTFATYCVEMDFDVKTLSEILGHANIAITMNRYVHPTMKMKRESMNRLSSPFLVR